MTIKHAKTSTIPDSADPNQIHASDWNADHVGINPHGHTGADDGGEIVGVQGPTGDKGPSGDAGTAWPIGSVFISVVSTNPNTLLGFGTWESFGAGRVLVGLDSGDTDFDTVEETGGSKTSTPDSHTGAAVADHAAKNTGQADVGATKTGTTNSTVTLKAHLHSVSAYIHTVTQPNDHVALSVVQPYIVVYMWKRTA